MEQVSVPPRPAVVAAPFDSDDDDPTPFTECIPAVARRRAAAAAGAVQSSGVSISSCSEATAALRTRVVASESDDDDLGGGSDDDEALPQAETAAETARRVALERKAAGLRQALEPLEDDDGTGGTAAVLVPSGVVPPETISAVPVATVASLIGNLVVCDRVPLPSVPVLAVGAALVLRDGTFVGFVQANIGHVQQCAYVVALDNPRNGHAAEGPALEALKASLTEGTAVYSSTVALHVIYDPESLRGGATDASSVGDLPLAPHQRPDFSDDEEERQWKANRKQQRLLEGQRRGDDQSTVSSVSTDVGMELVGDLVDDEGCVIAQASSSVLKKSPRGAPTQTPAPTAAPSAPRQTLPSTGVEAVAVRRPVPSAAVQHGAGLAHPHGNASPYPHAHAHANNAPMAHPRLGAPLDRYSDTTTARLGLNTMATPAVSMVTGGRQDYTNRRYAAAPYQPQMHQQQSAPAQYAQPTQHSQAMQQPLMQQPMMHQPMMHQRASNAAGYHTGNIRPATMPGEFDTREQQMRRPQPPPVYNQPSPVVQPQPQPEATAPALRTVVYPHSVYTPGRPPVPVGEEPVAAWPPQQYNPHRPGTVLMRPPPPPLQ